MRRRLRREVQRHAVAAAGRVNDDLVALGVEGVTARQQRRLRLRQARGLEALGAASWADTAINCELIALSSLSIWLNSVDSWEPTELCTVCSYAVLMASTALSEVCSSLPLYVTVTRLPFEGVPATTVWAEKSSAESPRGGLMLLPTPAAAAAS